MEIKKVLMHTCFQQDHPLSPVKCRCRKYIPAVDALRMIAEGTAQVVVKKYVDLEVQEPCPICAGDEKLVRSCFACSKLGKVTVTKKQPIYGEDVIVTVGERKNKFANTTAKKTPRSPTIESNHILRGIGAFGGIVDAARERWDEYEQLTLKERIRLLVPRIPVNIFDAVWNLWQSNPELPFPFILNPEPEDDLKTGTGRRFDYGRSI
jgi:hypothetical protein